MNLAFSVLTSTTSSNVSVNSAVFISSSKASTTGLVTSLTNPPTPTCSGVELGIPMTGLPLSTSFPAISRIDPSVNEM